MIKYVLGNVIGNAEAQKAVLASELRMAMNR